MQGRTSWIGLFVACGIGVCSGAAAAQPAAPPAGYKVEEKYTQKSPLRDNDRAIPVQGYGRLEMAVLGAPAGRIHAA